MYLASARTIVKMKLSRCCQIFFLIVIVKWSYCETDRCDNVVIQKLCLDQEICDKCLQADECCNWCYDQVKIITRLKIIKSLLHKNFWESQNEKKMVILSILWLTSLTIPWSSFTDRFVRTLITIFTVDKYWIHI